MMFKKDDALPIYDVDEKKPLSIASDEVLRAERVTVPLFEISSSQSVKLSDLKERRFTFEMPKDLYLFGIRFEVPEAAIENFPLAAHVIEVHIVQREGAYIVLRVSQTFGGETLESPLECTDLFTALTEAWKKILDVKVMNPKESEGYYYPKDIYVIDGVDCISLRRLIDAIKISVTNQWKADDILTMVYDINERIDDYFERFI